MLAERFLYFPHFLPPRLCCRVKLIALRGNHTKIVLLERPSITLSFYKPESLAMASEECFYYTKAPVDYFAAILKPKICSKSLSLLLLQQYNS